MELYGKIIELLVQAILFAGGYLKLQHAMVKAKQEIKDHNEASVKEANGSFGYAVQSMTMPICIKVCNIDDDGTLRFIVLQVNAAFANLYGLQSEDMKGKTEIAAGIPKSLADANYEKDVQVWSSQTPQKYIKNLPDGSQRTFEKIAFADKKGKVIGVLEYQYGSRCASPVSGQS